MSALEDTPDDAERIHAYAVELAAMAQNGLTYGTDKYDIARYERIRSMAAELLAMLADSEPGPFRRALADEAGHATPKVDVRGALFEGSRILLVREARDGLWTLPGGWADAMDTPSEAAVREFYEEAGLRVRATRLAAVHDGSRHNGHSGSPFHTYKLFFLVERLDDAPPRAGLDGETTEVDFFSLDDLPPLSVTRNTEAQLRLMLDMSRDPGSPAAYD
jgi:ADP-ribose pyrophosphatase YjhB (NUDIX family)